MSLQGTFSKQSPKCTPGGSGTDEGVEKRTPIKGSKTNNPALLSSTSRSDLQYRYRRMVGWLLNGTVGSLTTAQNTQTVDSNDSSVQMR